MIFINVFILRQCLLILLVLGDKIIEVGLSLSELHLVHALPSVPVEESLPPEHGRELLSNPLEDLLNGGGVTDECGSHGQTSGWDITHCNLDIVWNPFNKIGGIFVLNRQHLFINLFHRHSSTENCSNCEISSMPGICRSHHILGVKHLLSQLGHGAGPVLLGAPSHQGGKPGHEEVESGEWNHVDHQLPQVSIELTREPETCGHAG